MKRIKKLLIILLIFILIIPLIPKKYKVKDGGTVIYQSLIYRIEKAHSLKVPEGVTVGYRVYIFGKELFDNTYTTTACPYHDTP